MTYISPILGKIDDITMEKFIVKKSFVKSKEQISSFLDEIREETGFGALRAGILWTELSDKRLDIRGKELELYLQKVGFNRATDIMKLFVTNQTLVEDLVSMGYSLKEVLYNYDLKNRLLALGLVSRTSEVWYARDFLVSIYTVVRVEEEVEEVPEKGICYRTQLAYLYKTDDGRRSGSPEIVAEFRVWGVSDEKGKYKLSKFERVILQIERIFKGDGRKPVHWINSVDKVIKASEEDEEIDCDEAGTDLNYAKRGAAFRGEMSESEVGFGTEGKKYTEAFGELVIEYNERWIKWMETKMINAGLLVTRFDNAKGVLVNITDILKKED